MDIRHEQDILKRNAELEKELAAKNRELEIEAALEKVRGRTMTMQRSEELPETSYLLFQQLKELGETAAQLSIGIIKEEGFVELSATIHGSQLLQTYDIPMDEPFVMKKALKAWKAKERSLVVELKGKELKDYNNWRNSLLGKKIVFPEEQWIVNIVYFSKGFLSFSSDKEIPEETFRLLERFAGVFDQTYTRFLDLQNAEAQAREAKIEAALERVRAKTMAMHKSSDLLDVVKILGEQFELLGFKFNSVNFDTDFQEKDWNLWLYNVGSAMYPGKIHIPYIDHPCFNRPLEAFKNGGDLHTFIFTKEEKDSLFDHIYTNSVAKYGSDERKRFTYAAPGFAMSIAVTKNTRITIANYDAEPFSEDENAILRRFANVFEQSYTRFLDLQKAEAQAREAEIELALERVRAKTMAMQKPSEFVEVINVIGEQFVNLGFDIEWVNFGANGLDISKGIDIWNFAVIPGGTHMSDRLFIPYFDHPVFSTAAEQLDKYHRTGNDFFMIAFDKDIKDSWLDHLFTKTIFKDVPGEFKTVQYAKPGYTTSNIALKDTWLSIGKFDTRSFTDDQHAILKKFAKAFGQAYTRFLDLQKAEAQAREAQIEAALERVRSRAMAMQTSEELNELIGTVFTELTKLDLVLTRCVILIYEGNEKGVRWWMANSEAPSTPMNFFVKYADLPFFNAYLKGWHDRSLKWQYILEGEDKIRTDNVLFNETELSLLPDFVKAGMKASDRVYLSSSFNNYGCLNLASLEPLSDEHFDILLRFAKVFDLTYTRFNDLKQAEAQARESRIQLSLERVRARTMAMHKSDELSEVVAVLYKQFEELDFEFYQVLVSIYDKKNNVIEWWSRGFGDVELPQGNIIPIIDHPFCNDLLEKWESGVEYYPHILEGEIKKSWGEYLFTKTDLKNFPQEVKDTMMSFDKVYLSDVFMKYGSLQAAGPAPLPDDKADILKRFVKVLDLAYTRMMDLQTAESQAREAKIEVALERVRARTMAMQRSDELGDTSALLFRQFTSLSYGPERMSIGIFREEKQILDLWTTGHEAEHTPGFFQVSLNEPHAISKGYRAWKQQSRSLVVELSGDVLKEYIQYWKNIGLVNYSDAIKDRILINTAFFSKGYIGFISLERLPQQTIELLERFAGVFDLTYTRFLDLQKAEAQTREAQIELALERVRARTMAMHKSEELSETASVLFHELKNLGIQTIRSGVGIFNGETDTAELWLTSESDKKIETRIIGTVHSSAHPAFQTWFNAWKQKKPSFTFELTGDAVRNYYETLSAYLSLPPQQAYHSKECLNGFFFPEGSLNVITQEPLSDESINIMLRFARVFGLLYRRFLDLQNAEMQAREARIEAALEKVRSRSLAMHKSDELQEVVNTVFERLQDLNIEMDSANIAIFKEGTRDYDYWIASPFQKRTASFHMPYIDLSLTRDLIAARESGKDFSTTAYSFEEKNEWFDYTFKNTDFKFLTEERKQFILNAPGIMVAIAFSKHTGVQVNRYSGKLLTEGEVEILKRFSKVFEQAYIRFLDLEKAEAQARESQIEASLERVRAKAMAMHKSDDLHEAVKIMFEEFHKLNLDVLRCGIGILNKDSRTGAVWTTSISDNGLAVQISANESFDTHPLMTLIYDYWQKQEDLDYVLQGQDLINYYRAMDASELKLPKSQLFFSDDKLQTQYYYAAMFNAGGLYSFRDKPFTAEDRKIMKRFASVVNLTYNRFLDLQKAEAQAREAKIEASLERVRAKAMAMHKSEDLNSAVATVFEELDKLDLGVLRCGISILDKEKRTGDIWVTSITDQGSAVQVSGDESFDIHPLLQGAFEAWLKKEDFSYLLEGEDLSQYYKAVKAANFQLPESQIITSETDPIAIGFKKQYCYTTPYGAGGLFAFRETEFPEEAKIVMKRFAGVFDLTYKRFLDLQKAEANAREAKIEAALERVRSRTMAMHKSDELSETAVVLFKQLSELGNDPDRFSIGIIDEAANVMNVYATDQEGSQVNIRFKARMDEKTTIQRMYTGWKTKLKSDVIHLTGKNLEDWIKYLRDELGMAINDEHFKGQRFHNVAYFSQGWLNFTTIEPTSKETLSLLERFAAVFNLTYRRFQDLQKAEANAKEAQIEAGLERVRARTMAMHSSDDVGAATATMFIELEKLGIQNLRGGITIIRPDQTQEVWSITNLADGTTLRAIGVFDMRLHPLWRALFKAKENKESYDYYWLAGKDKEDYIALLNATPNYLAQPIKEIPDVHVQSYFFDEGGVWTNSLQPHSEEDKQVMKRFTSVFSLTFRRYQDLKKAEAQAREATIEAALERVRGKAMAMHNSKDLAATIGVFYHELEGLSLTPRRCGIGLINKETHIGELSTMSSTGDGQSIQMIGKLDLRSHPLLVGVYDNWLTKTEYHPVLRGNAIKEYYQLLRPQMAFPDFPNDSVQYGYFFFFEEGGVYAWTEKELGEDELKIYRRFTSVLSLTYKRYRDLKDAEIRAQIAIKDAALDRIRADIASMRTVNDLDRITPLIWNELSVLGIPFIRCGVFIMDEQQQLIHTFLSTPEGRAIAAFHLPYTTPGNIQNVLSNWHVKKSYIDHWDESAFTEFAGTLAKQGGLASPEQYLKTIPKGGFYLHFLPFLQGMLYVGNTNQLNEEQIELIQHVADAFSTAYARYEDFNKLEAAKQQVEKTLTDLKQAQTQLVQSEKMASLGELTAGIAHEIQNPLNFVNNFSDVSSELLDEMKAELKNGNAEDAMAIAEDVKQNLEKILHHGKRADAIVKGMLQHSRTSSGQKEPTDINVLADEYLRLAFHGLRAKDKSFNAKFETDFDNTIGKINIIPQDIGRVILNLINNAFYAVTEKKKSGIENYEPTVTVSTKTVKPPLGGLGVEIKVKDNGNGIPPKVLDKIFQPFFTTKPTGQGTGLGLSLSYDIVTKGHGGELKVETKEGKGSEFIISLPG